MTPSTQEPVELASLDLIQYLKRSPSEHKGDAGKVVIIGGAPGMAGALILAGNATLHLGAGWTILEMLDHSSSQVLIDQPELMVRAAGSDAAELLIKTHPDLIAIGPGLGNSSLAYEWLQASLAHPEIPLVLDADALNLIADNEELLQALQKRNQQFPGLSVITPHPGEAARLLKISNEQVQSQRLTALKNLVQLTDSIVVLKGQHTLIASPQHSSVQCMQGNPGMGTGGMGDVLTGSIAAIAAQGIGHQLDLWSSTCIAVQLHASAADSLVNKGVGPIGLTPSETILEMRSMLNRLL
jgi:hydroxyethylthiazole kinase-like uncharacterized protein yjeF